LVRKRSAFATVIAGAPSASLAESCSSALPGLRALLGTLPVVRLGDGAVLVVRVSSSVLLPVASPELSSIVVIFSCSRDGFVTESNGGWNSVNLDVLNVVVLGLNNGEESSECKEFHYYNYKLNLTTCG